MDLNFRKVDLAQAANAEGASVRSLAPEVMLYTRGGFAVVVQVFFRVAEVVAYEPVIDGQLPPGMAEAQVREEIHAGVACNAECPVVWRTG